MTEQPSGCGYCGDRPDQLAGLVELVAVHALGALEGAPAEVLGRLVGLEQDAVDLLDAVLADVADPQLAERGVEGEPPRVAQAAEHDVPCGLRLAHVGGEDLAELLLRVLRGPARVEGAAAVAEPEVEPPVGAEQQLAAVVVLLGLVDEEQLAQRLGAIVPPRPARNSATRVSPFGSDQCR